MNLRHFFLSSVVVTMADTPKIEKRLRAILEAGQRSHGGAHRRIGRAGMATAALLALTAFGSLAVLRPVAVRAQQPSPGAAEQASRTNDDRVAKQIACLNNLKIIGRSLAMYAQDYDEKLPPLTSNAALKNRLGPYVVGFYIRQGKEQNRPDALLTLPPLRPGPRLDVTPIFTCPETKQPYLPIAALSEKGLDRLSNPASTMIVRDTTPHPGRVPAYQNGLWNVVYADGHVKAEGKVPAIPPLRPVPPAVQRVRAARDQERAARRLRAYFQGLRQERDSNAASLQVAQARLAIAQAEVAAAQVRLDAIRAEGRGQQERSSLATARRNLADAQARLNAALWARRAAASAASGAQHPRTFQVAYAVPADGKTHRLRIEVGDANGNINTAIAETAEPGARFRKQVTARGSRVTLRLYDNDALKYEHTR